MTSFKPHPNNVSTCLSSHYTAGSGSLVVDAGTGALFGSTFPMTVTAITALSYGTPEEVSAIFNVTARSGDTLTISAAIEGTIDRDFAADDRVEVRWTSGLAGAIEGAVNNLESNLLTTVMITGSYANPSWLTSLAGSKITGGIAGSAGSLSGTITTSQVSDLSSWPGSTAITTLGTISTGKADAALITSGVIAPARLGGGTPNNLNWLRGDGNYSRLWVPVPVSGNGSIAVGQTFSQVDTSGGAITSLALPAASTNNNVEYLIMVVSGTNACTIVRSGTDSIFGGTGNTSYVLTGILKYVRLISIGTGYLIVGSN